jgi:hypothetical protein
MGEVERARILLSETLAEMGAHPLRSVALVPKKVAILFSPYSYLGLDVPYLLMLPFAIYGLFRLTSFGWDAIWTLGVPVANVVGIAAIVFGDVRFRHPADPELALAAAFGIATLLRAGTRQSDRAAGPEGAGGAWSAAAPRVTMSSVRKARPFAAVSRMKSIDQCSFARTAATSGAGISAATRSRDGRRT